jgi:hypothetical protein
LLALSAPFLPDPVNPYVDLPPLTLVPQGTKRKVDGSPHADEPPMTKVSIISSLSVSYNTQRDGVLYRCTTLGMEARVAISTMWRRGPRITTIRPTCILPMVKKVLRNTHLRRAHTMSNIFMAKVL